jgi:transglycosylase-like protein with SLT domain
VPKAEPLPWARMARLSSVCAALLLASASQPVAAALVVLSGGEVVKSFRYEVVGENARLTFETGGAITLPLDRVERVVDDEVEPTVAEPAAAPSVEPGFAFQFDPQHPVPADPYGAVIYEAAKKHALNPALVAAVVRTESGGRVKAVSRKGACGLMQIMPATGKRFGLRRAELFDAGKNVDAGSRYLAWLLDRYDGDLSKSLAAYNAGEGTVDRYGGVPPYRETRGYVQRVFSLLGLAAGAAGSATPATATAAVASLSR